MTSRRDFLQKITLSTGLASLAPTLLSATPATNSAQQPARKLRVAIMGLGSYGTRVAKAMKDCQSAELVGIVTGSPEKIPVWKKEYNIPDKNVYNYETVGQMKNNPDIDVVYVITPNSLHAKHVMQVAAAGKHVICEKPMADTAANARKMIAACEKAGVKLLIGYRLHFEPYTRKVIEMIQAGEMGKLNYIDNYQGFKIGDPTQWRLKKSLAGGGALMDVGIYCLNAARYLSNEEPIWVTAQETKTDPVKFAEVDETIQFQLGFPSGLVASCATSYNIRFERLYAQGDKGFAELSPAYGYGPIKGRTHKGPLDEPVVTHQTAQMDGMADIILNNKTIDPPVDGQEGLKDMIVLDAIYESIRKGSAKMKL
ncbi:Gfo/Idh/MocA family protein [Persicitalea jodogahamensis]|uniref:Glucose-fructose oxidoreductase n=1 Tax=Persicitalea jodogahamensis TaxID=402147 RepID=A0A8J3DBV5_9BACT|nr:Gfo/Idh/MocA family oxidoreductase [Persicitalea jodogahamensis]GHB73982.1 glucose-fructose oxidoreductase [Persicitalea jodogahamensis]